MLHGILLMVVILICFALYYQINVCPSRNNLSQTMQVAPTPVQRGVPSTPNTASPYSSPYGTPRRFAHNPTSPFVPQTNLN